MWRAPGLPVCVIMSLPGPARIAELTRAAWVVYAYPQAVLAGADPALLLSWLSDDERERHARFRFQDDREAYLVAHALTRRALGQVAGVAPSALSFQAGEHGRPEIAGPSCALALRFNLSHTRGLVACGVACGHDIGVDVERIDREVALLGVARHVFSERENAGLSSLSGSVQRLRFFELWTLKEAYVKAIGKGLAAPLKSISFLPEASDPVAVHFAEQALDDPSAWCFRRHEPGPNHRLAVALRAGPLAAVSFNEVSASQLVDWVL
jgi:4'-phosphopantetheinyl transferase